MQVLKERSASNFSGVRVLSNVGLSFAPEMGTGMENPAPAAKVFKNPGNGRSKKERFRSEESEGDGESWQRHSPEENCENSEKPVQTRRNSQPGLRSGYRIAKFGLQSGWRANHFAPLHPFSWSGRKCAFG
ncbi:MAG: hypothetical protein ACRD4M_08450 [Candidatus Acidiferrales bacterium]